MNRTSSSSPAGVTALRVIVHIPSASLELKGWSGEKTVYFAAALLVHGKRLISKLLDYLEQITAIFTFVFVKRHKNVRF